jgi:FtsP/CotA-like multicopper oxidase with cupredoxin domain
MRGTTNAHLKAAAANAARRRAATPRQSSGSLAITPKQSTATFGSQTVLGAQTNAATAGPALTADQLYFGTFSNYANSPLPALKLDPTGAIIGTVPSTGIRKFIDPLPPMGCSPGMTKCIPVAHPDIVTFPGSDYYEIEVTQFSEKLHSDLPPTTIRGYKQVNNGTDTSVCGGVSLPACTAANNTLLPEGAHYLGPIIVANSGRPVRIKLINGLPTGTSGNLFIPTDTTIMGAGMGPDGTPYLQNRSLFHLHGGATPWISDGTPHQWTVPAGDFTATTNPRGMAAQFVPDMYFVNGVVVPQCSASVTTNCSGGTPQQLPANATNDPGPGNLTYFYTNQQSARLMFYHDHSYGITRLTVYAGQAAGYILQDPVEQTMISGGTIGSVPVAAGTIPALQIPLVIQDKSFVPGNPASAPVYSIALLAPGSGYTAPTVTISGGGCTSAPTATATVGEAVDPYGVLIEGAITSIALTNAGAGCTSPPAVAITDPTGTGAAAFASLATLATQDPTWSWGTGASDTPNGNGDLWFPHVYMPNQWPDNPDGSSVNPMGRWDYASWFWPPFNNGVNGQYKIRGPVPCPTAANPNMTCPGTPSVVDPAPGGSTASLVPEAFMDTPVVNGEAYPTLTVPPQAVRFRILNAANDRTFNLSLFIACGTGGYTPSANATCPAPPAGAANLATGTEVGMVAAAPTPGFPAYWPTDGRDGGVPDPKAAGPSWIQIGTEGGFLPAPAVIPPTPINYEYARRSVTVTNVSSKGILLGPAERADVIVDFSQYAGKTIILYNDGPAPIPAFDPRYDYYTGDPDQTAMGGAPTTLAGYGPNTRTIMQIVVSGAAGASANLTGLQTALPAAFAQTQPEIIVPQAAYNKVYNKSFPNNYAHLQDYSMTFTPANGSTPTTMQLTDKAIQELFELNFGRMNATLGIELPFTNFNTQTTIPLGYIDPPTETIKDSSGVISQPVGVLGDGTQIWKITHNGVDTHAIHVHLFNAQLINRVGWDGTVRPPDANELGWKETFRMNPLEIDFIALRPIEPSLPFKIPDSIRPLDVTMMPSSTISVTDPATGNAVNIANANTNFGWEYVWHCHLLGHEENDMMRPIIFQVPPDAPSNLTATPSTSPAGVQLTWIDPSASVSQANAIPGSTGFTVQRALDSAFTSQLTTLPTVGPSTGIGAQVSILDDSAAPLTTYYYRVQSFTPNGASLWSNTAQVVYPPAASVNPTSLTFASQLIFTTSTAQAVTLSNAGGGTLNILGISIGGTNANDFAIQTNTCGATLTQAQSCSISVTFTPTARGARSAVLTISSNDPANPTLNVPLTGTAYAVVTVSPTSLTFPPTIVAGGSSSQLINIQNVSGSIATFTQSISGPFMFSATNCPASLLVGHGCQIWIRFIPSALGPATGSVTITAGGGSQSVNLSGTGILGPITFNPTSLAFPTTAVGQGSSSQPIKILNQSGFPITVTPTGITADFIVSYNYCTGTVPNNTGCYIYVRFTPKSVGALAGALTINAGGTIGMINLSGTGVMGPINIDKTSLVFPPTVVGLGSSSQMVTLFNNSGFPITVAPSITGDFVISNNSCTGTIAPGGTQCYIWVRFAPKSVSNSLSGTLTINANGSLVGNVSLSGSGI